MGLSLEIVIKYDLIKNALKGISWSRTLAGTARRVRLPVLWEMLLEGERWLRHGAVAVAFVGLLGDGVCFHYIYMRSDEVFAGV